MRGKGKRIGLAAAGILLLCSLYSGSQVKQFADTMSVKYRDGGLTGEQIDRLHDSAEKKEKELPYVTGWNTKEGIAIANQELGREVPANLIEVYGTMQEVIPQTLLLGSYVEKEDKKGCTVSFKTAEKLFGSRRVIGCEVTALEQQYIIRGVIQSEEDIFMVQAAQEDSFPYLELHYERENYPASNAKVFLSMQGLPAYDSFTEGNLYAGMAGIFMGIPFFILFVILLRSLHGQMQQEQRKWPYCLKNGLLVTAALFSLVLIVKYSLSFSDDFIPSKVSDFTFWVNKYKEVRIDYKLLLQYQTGYKESIILDSLRNCAVTSLVSEILLFTSCRLLNSSVREKA